MHATFVDCAVGILLVYFANFNTETEGIDGSRCSYMVTYIPCKEIRSADARCENARSTDVRCKVSGQLTKDVKM